ncbi:MAG: hypothetical protein ABIN48_14865, partial [Ginsengibacter sp.]
MKNYPLREKIILFFIACSIFIFVSCKKQESEIVKQEEQLTILNDSASYMINGKVYICDKVSLFGKGNNKANYDSVTNKWDADSMLYYSEFALNKKVDDD